MNRNLLIGSKHSFILLAMIISSSSSSCIVHPIIYFSATHIHFFLSNHPAFHFPTRFLSLVRHHHPSIIYPPLHPYSKVSIIHTLIIIHCQLYIVTFHLPVSTILSLTHNPNTLYYFKYFIYPCYVSIPLAYMSMGQYIHPSVS